MPIAITAPPIHSHSTIGLTNTLSVTSRSVGTGATADGAIVK